MALTDYDDPRGPWTDGRISPLLAFARTVSPQDKERIVDMVVDVLMLDGLKPGVTARVIRALRRQLALFEQL